MWALRHEISVRTDARSPHGDATRAPRTPPAAHRVAIPPVRASPRNPGRCFCTFELHGTSHLDGGRNYRKPGSMSSDSSGTGGIVCFASAAPFEGPRHVPALWRGSRKYGLFAPYRGDEATTAVNRNQGGAATALATARPLVRASRVSSRPPVPGVIAALRHPSCAPTRRMALTPAACRCYRPALWVWV